MVRCRWRGKSPSHPAHPIGARLVEGFQRGWRNAPSCHGVEGSAECSLAAPEAAGFQRAGTLFGRWGRAARLGWGERSLHDGTDPPRTRSVVMGLAKCHLAGDAMGAQRPLPRSGWVLPRTPCHQHNVHISPSAQRAHLAISTTCASRHLLTHHLPFQGHTAPEKYSVCLWFCPFSSSAIKMLCVDL